MVSLWDWEMGVNIYFSLACKKIYLLIFYIISSELWKNPLEFQPERWLDPENPIPTQNFLPFQVLSLSLSFPLPSLFFFHFNTDKITIP